MELEKLKNEIQKVVEADRRKLIDLSLKIHGNPELGWQEEKSSGWLADYLEKYDFRVERGICDLPTAFKARYGEGTPVIAFIAEYDALPDVGHGCGHNIIGTSSVGAGIATKIVADQFDSTILVIGTPAEERLGGKILMVDKGAFDGIDVALMVHPRGKYNPVGLRFLAAISLEVEFWGKSSHAAAAPWDGISALEALILAINNINALRSHTRDRTRIAGIITDGGKFPNVVPEHAAATFMIRAADDASLEELCEKVLNCFRGAALTTGTRLDYQWGLKCAAMRNNSVLMQLWADNMRILGRQVEDISDTGGSTDMGNVSAVMPGIHPFMAVSSEPLASHTTEFAVAAASTVGMEALIDGAKSLAMTAADVISQPGMLSRIKEEFLHPQQL